MFSITKKQRSGSLPHQESLSSVLQDMDNEDIKKSLWHAFDLLDTSSHLKKIRSTHVPKTKLMVLTNNLGHLLGVEKAETIWDRVLDTSINFDKFMDVLNNNLLVGLEKNPEDRVAFLKAEIDQLCWLLCEKSYLQQIRTKQAPSQQNDVHSEDEAPVVTEKTTGKEFDAEAYFKLWKIFNFLVERAEDGTLLFPLRTDIEEAERIAELICQSVGLPVSKNDCLKRSGSIDSNNNSFLLDFSEFVRLILNRVSSQEDFTMVSRGIFEVHQQIKSDVVRKGLLVMFGNIVTGWKVWWFVLTATALHYYAASDEKDLKGSIALCSECFTQSFPDEPGGRQHRLKLSAQSKHYELSAPDLKSKNEWISDFKRVITNTGKCKESLQQQAWRERKKEREERRRSTAEEEMRLQSEREDLVAQSKQALEAEREQRALVEARLREEEVELEEERRRLRELEEAKASLEHLIEVERALKRDEETVRKRQASILEEEYAKREELERLQAEQGQELLKEKMSRKELEEAHQQNEEALRFAREQLEALAKEREQADQRLQDAAKKLQQAEQDRQQMVARLKLKEMTSSNRLAQPLPKPDPNPFVTHRGLGAFTDADFSKKLNLNNELNEDNCTESVDQHLSQTRGSNTE